MSSEGRPGSGVVGKLNLRGGLDVSRKDLKESTLEKVFRKDPDEIDVY